MVEMCWLFEIWWVFLVKNSRQKAVEKFEIKLLFEYIHLCQKVSNYETCGKNEPKFCF
jgi:hypothetical protein